MLTVRIKIWGRTIKWAEQYILLIEKAKWPKYSLQKKLRREIIEVLVIHLSTLPYFRQLNNLPHK